MQALRVVHHDEHLAIVDKPAGVLVVPAPGRTGRTVLDLAAEALGRPVQAVHRLDEDTTGALMVALTDSARAALEGLFRDHEVVREYLALASAAPSPPAGRVEAALAEGPDGLVRVVASGGRRAVTHYETLARRGRCTLLHCRLETGRRNQIRVHLAALGCPLAGDRKYGYRPRPGEHFRRVMLHSWRMRLRHPLTGAAIDCVVPPAEPELRP